MSHREERRIRVRAIRREQPDLVKLGRALVELAQAEAEAEQIHRQQGSGRNAKRQRPLGEPAQGTE